MADCEDSVESFITVYALEEYRSEYFDGMILPRASASREHNLIAGNASRELGNQLKGRPCETYQSDMRVKVSRAELYTYPDVVVVCGEPAFEDAEVDTLLNPTLIVEVLSTTTEAYDRGDKFEQYRTLESLQEYVLIAQDRYRVERFVRQPDGQWLFAAANRLDQVVSLASIDCRLPLAEVYDRLELPKPPPAAASS